MNRLTCYFCGRTLLEVDDQGTGAVLDPPILFRRRCTNRRCSARPVVTFRIAERGRVERVALDTFVGRGVR